MPGGRVHVPRGLTPSLVLHGVPTGGAESGLQETLSLGSLSSPSERMGRLLNTDTYLPQVWRLRVGGRALADAVSGENPPPGSQGTPHCVLARQRR